MAGTDPTEHAATEETREQLVPLDATDATFPACVPPTLDIYLLSPFQVYCNDSQITDWPNCKGKSVFKYLAANRERPIGKEVLMDIFWPEADASAARNNLNVAIYGLRKELTGGGMAFPFILFQDGCYLLNPDLRIWIDAEAFREHREAALRLEQLGDIEHAVQQYCAAEVLYQQPFLAEDRYEEWISLPRQAMEQAYLEVLDRLSQHYFEQKNYNACALACRKMLGVDGCNEGPHRQLMRCYSRLGQAHLALRQFHVCAETLSRELKLYPSPQTVDLFRRVQNQQPV
jgi:DNA-binding SARP family transcriptional activator